MRLGRVVKRALVVKDRIGLLIRYGLKGVLVEDATDVGRIEYRNFINHVPVVEDHAIVTRRLRLFQHLFLIGKVESFVPGMKRVAQLHMHGTEIGPRLAYVSEGPSI